MRRSVAAFVCTALVFIGGVSVASLQPAAAVGVTRFVATTGSDVANTCTVSVAPCLTLGHALSRAAAGDTIQLAPGTYLVSHNPTGTANSVPAALHDVTIESDPVGGTAANTIVDATSTANGLVVNANGVTVKRLTFRNADREGIVVSPPAGATTPAGVTHLTLTGDTVTTNDQCSKHPSATDCVPQNGALLPYGAGVTLSAVSHSTVSGNTVTANWGGIRLDDAMGPSTANTISGNLLANNGKSGVIGNVAAAGIFVMSDNAFAVTASGVTQPAMGGVYGNTISGNTTETNGAAGIAMVGFSPGNAVYANTVTQNVAGNNGTAGIEIKTLSASEHMNDNVITDNRVGRNALVGGVDGGPGDSDAGDIHTTGILVLAWELDSGTPITGTVITGNEISDNYFGVWMSLFTTHATVSGNPTVFDTGGAAIHVQRFAALIVGIARTPSGHGYWQVQSDGSVFPFGDAGYYGSLGGVPIHRPIVGFAPTPSGNGYWLVASDGGIFSFGDAAFHGSTGAIHLNKPVVGMATTATGLGYWLVASDGGIFSFGDAAFHGSTGAIHLNKPVGGMATTVTGLGYWLVASDGGIFSFGDAAFHGSTGALHLNKPVIGMAVGPSGDGYWLDATDGGIFSFGSAKFHGSTGGIQLVSPADGMAATATGLGYWLVTSDGGIFAFGDAQYYGSVSANPTG